MFFRCQTCPSLLSRPIPLCDDCTKSLILCPNICNDCCGFCTSLKCDRPWITFPSIKTFTAQYLLVGHCYQIIRTWKNRGGLEFDSEILRLDTLKLAELKKHKISAVVPLPQKLSRSWKLRRSPAASLSHKISRSLETLSIPELLKPPQKTERQAMLSHEARVASKIKFELGYTNYYSLKNTNILLVDDIMTTGSSLASAAECLETLGVNIHAFALGIRAPRSLDAL